MSSGKRFSVVLPVRNGGEYVKQCVASILAQTLADNFELLILDNASTDGTAEWLATLTDQRIRLYPAERPLSIEENWSRIKNLPKGKFLTMIGHDDLLDPNFLEIVTRLIEEYPDAGLYQTHFRLIDSNGTFLRRCQPMPIREGAAEFVAARLCQLRDSFGTGHVMRSIDYDSINGIPPFLKLLYADDALFVQVIGSSYQATSTEEAFSYRLHSISASGACSLQESFGAFEAYASLLQTQARTDAVLWETLHRYFANYATLLGHGWLWQERLLAYQQRRQVSPEVALRFRVLVTLFDRDYLPPPESFWSRLLERAPRSRLHRCLFHAAYSAQRLRRRAETFLQGVLRGSSVVLGTR